GGAGRPRPGRGDPGPLRGQPVLRRGAAGRPPGRHAAAAGPAGGGRGPVEAPRGGVEGAGVAGSRGGHERLAAVVEQETDELVGLLREAVTRHVLAVDEANTYVFRHALVQEAIYDDLLPVQRGPLHAAYARALERRVERR